MDNSNSQSQQNQQLTYPFCIHSIINRILLNCTNRLSENKNYLSIIKLDKLILIIEDLNQKYIFKNNLDYNFYEIISHKWAKIEVDVFWFVKYLISSQHLR